MNLASEVPPVVEKTGFIFVTFFIIFFAKRIFFPGVVKKESPLSK